MKRTVLIAFGILVHGFAAQFASAQAQTWIVQPGALFSDSAFAVARDGSGGVFAGGSTLNSFFGPNLGFHDAWLVRYDAAGAQLWGRQFGSNGRDELSDAWPDGTGGVLVCGLTFGFLGGPNAGVEDVWLARHDALGNELWLRQFGSAQRDVATAITTDGADGLYVGGWTEGSLAGPHAGFRDAWIAHYDGAGNRTWIRQLGAAGYEFAVDAAPDGQGGVYLAGSCTGGFAGPSAGEWDPWLARFDAAGNQLWIRQFGSIDTDAAEGLAEDGAGGVYIAGFTNGSFGGPSAGLDDAWLARFDGSGVQLWIHQTGTGGVDAWWAATSDGAGGVYVGGQTDGSIGGVSTDVLLGHYSGSGELTWLSELGTLRYEAVFSLAFNGLDGMFVCGETDGALGGPYHGINGWTDAWVANYGGPCSWPTIYCAAKVNSIGCTPTISTQGIPSSSAAGGFTIRAESARNQKTGLLLYGLNGPAANPFQGGTLCVAAPVRRTTSVSSGGSPLPVADCSGVYEIDFNAFSAGALGGNPQAALRTPGTQVHAQWWGRDPGFPPPNNTTLSNAVHLSMCL